MSERCKCGHYKRNHNPTREWCWKCRACTGFRIPESAAESLVALLRRDDHQ